MSGLIAVELGFWGEGMAIAKGMSLPSLMLAAQPSQGSPPIRPRRDCPVDLEELVPSLLHDLPSYANRVNQRAYTNFRTSEIPGYLLLAGRPDYEPIDLGPGNYQTSADELSQVFFTTLERQYLPDRAVELQHYHWLFLARTENGWRLALLFSTLGDYPNTQPPTPPQDTSQGVIAQAIRLWLRDCEAGSIQSVDRAIDQLPP